MKSRRLVCVVAEDYVCLDISKTGSYINIEAFDSSDSSYIDVHLNRNAAEELAIALTEFFDELDQED